MLKVLFARHRNVYLKLALKYWVLPSKVYKLAHGGNAKTDKDGQILHDLLDRKIIHRHHFSQNPDDYKM